VRPAPVPKMVQDFVVYFYRHIRERNIREIYTMYSHTFPVLSDRFFKGSMWPKAEDIGHLVDHDHVFCMLYKELYFRHIYATSKPSIEQRRESWENYRDLFTVILNSNLNMQLPNGWLWDMIDEFVYQFQSFLQHRGRMAGKSAEEISALMAASEEGTWDAAAVLSYLSELVVRSRIREELKSAGGVEELYNTEGYSSTSSNVLRMLGYFSLIGVLRVHCVLGDPVAGLEALAPLNVFQRKGLFATKIAMAAITLAYYSGFAYLSLHRYLDASKCFNFGATYVTKVKGHASRGPGYDQILKKNEQMYALLAISMALCPTVSRQLEESVSNTLREKHGEKIKFMSAGSMETYEELFSYACPKFVSPTAPDWHDSSCNTNAMAFKAQWAPFMAVIEERKHLPAIKQVLKLYSSIPISKIASLSELDEQSLREQLDLLRRTSSVLTWTAGDALQGEPQQCGDIDFSVESQGGEDLVVVKESKGTTVKGDFLVRHIQKFEDIVRDLDSMSVPSATVGGPAGGGAASA
jgi:translation initiation factor 3 subunit L